MIRRCLCLLSIISAIEQTKLHDIQYEAIPDVSAVQNNMIVVNKREYESFNGEKVSKFTKWSQWSDCVRGQKSRRKHCLRSHVCGDSIRLEVTSCNDSVNRLGVLASKETAKENILPATSIRQLHTDEVQKRFRGFSPWSAWSGCSKRCSTVRKRHCVRRDICGQKVVRQSAYCYLEGTFCQQWIRTKMKRQRNPADRIVQQTLKTPVLAKHPEDTKSVAPKVVARMAANCGRAGRVRGSAAARRRARLRHMLRIIGGRPALPGKWPWQVAVLNRYKEAFCGGTLVSIRWVVTAAHCVRRRLYVRLGEHDLLLKNRGELEMRVTEAVVHPRYDPDTVVNDVALLRLPSPARPELGHGVACLPEPHQELHPHTSCVILGWGKKKASDAHGTRLLHEAQVSTIQQGVCRRSYWQYAITDDMVCAGRGRRDSCAGDSGGPLLCRDRNMRYYLQGITSFGDGCGKRGKYGIYTRTAGYVAWMRSVMNNIYFD